MKSIDQVGVPVTLNWLGDPEHKTRCGGICSIIGIFLVTTFVIGSFITYFSFSEFRTQTVVESVDVAGNLDCSAVDNECQFLNSTTFMPFVLLEDNHPASVKVSNLSTVIVPEFYTYQVDQFGVKTFTWHDAVDCTEMYTGVFGSYEDIPPSLRGELTPLHGNRWLCPNFGNSSYILQNDPWTQNVGTNLNFVVNFCTVSA